jgi:glycosyltransferase involved in cell wall biosynthesis
VDFIVDALRYLVEHHGEIKLVGIGPPGEFLFKQGLPIEVHPIMEHDRFRAFLASQHNAIAWIPLDDSRFNRCKSAVKYFDYSLAGIPVLCSNMVPYSEVIAHMGTGFLCSDDGGDWIKHSVDLIKSADLRKRIANRARTITSKEHGIERTASAWQQAIDSLRFVTNISPAVVETGNGESLIKTVLKRVFRPSAYVGAFRLYRLYGLKGMWNHLISLGSLR